MNDENELVYAQRNFDGSIVWYDTNGYTIHSKIKPPKIEYNDSGDGIEKRKYLDFKVGDLVKIRDWEDMARQYGVDSSSGIKCESYFPIEMRKYCGQKFIIEDDTFYETFALKPLDNKKGENIHSYEISKDMIEIVEEGYVEKMKQKREELEQNKEDVNESILKEMLSKVDITKVKRILAGSYNIPLTELKGVDKLLNQWAESKAEMYILLGNNLKVEKEIEFEMTASMVREKLIEICIKYPAFHYILNNLNTSELNDDIYRGSCSFLHQFNSNIRSGIKLTRFLSLVMNNKEFDIDISKIYENRKCKETICISIDPVDYLLMSINKSGWESCHKLHDMSSDGRSWGCYSAGTISYMVDGATLITYKHSDKVYDYQINKCKIKEYSKNWRQIIYYDTVTNAFITSREYPYSDENVSSEIRNWFEEIISNKMEFENKWVTAKNVGHNYCHNETSLHYNDVFNDRENVLCRPTNITRESIDIYVGGTPTCPICGEREIEEENHPMCENCYYDIC